MKHKIGDKVRVKSLEWYNENKSEYGEISGGDFYFTSRMSDFCGKIVTIDKIHEDDFYTIKEDEQTFVWTDNMFEDDDLEFQRAIAKIVKECSYDVDDDLEFQRAITKAVDECLWGEDDEIPTEKYVNDSVEFGKNVMKKKISEYLLKYLPMIPDDKEAFVEEMFKNIE